MTKNEAKKIIEIYKKEGSYLGVMDYLETNTYIIDTITIGEALVKQAKVKLEDKNINNI